MQYPQNRSNQAAPEDQRRTRLLIGQGILASIPTLTGCFGVVRGLGLRAFSYIEHDGGAVSEIVLGLTEWYEVKSGRPRVQLEHQLIQALFCRSLIMNQVIQGNLRRGWLYLEPGRGFPGKVERKTTYIVLV